MNKENDTFARDRLLDKAEELFSQHGYHGVSVRQITTAANCNLAAVNYHFGNKENLYLEVFNSRWVPRARLLHQSFIKSITSGNHSSPKKIIHAFVEALLQGPLPEDEGIRHHQLMARELSKPTGALEIVADQIQRPFIKEMMNLLKTYLAENEDEKSFTLKMLSIISMAMYFNFARPMVSHITGCQYDEAFRKQLVDHIAEFCTNGMGVKEEGRS